MDISVPITCQCGVSVRVKQFPLRCACGRVYNAAGLGDIVAAGLEKIGITEERYKDAKAAVGLKRQCNCPSRKKKLNELGHKLGIG